jgi:hypothetical protein
LLINLKKYSKREKLFLQPNKLIKSFCSKKKGKNQQQMQMAKLLAAPAAAVFCKL